MKDPKKVSAMLQQLWRCQNASTLCQHAMGNHDKYSHAAAHTFHTQLGIVHYRVHHVLGVHKSHTQECFSNLSKCVLLLQSWLLKCLAMCWDKCKRCNATLLHRLALSY